MAVHPQFDYEDKQRFYHNCNRDRKEKKRMCFYKLFKGFSRFIVSFDEMDKSKIIVYSEITGGSGGVSLRRSTLSYAGYNHENPDCLKSRGRGACLFFRDEQAKAFLKQLIQKKPTLKATFTYISWDEEWYNEYEFDTIELVDQIVKKYPDLLHTE